jgi:hypothetical protein
MTDFNLLDGFPAGSEQEIWDLLDREKSGSLTYDEFVEKFSGDDIVEKISGDDKLFHELTMGRLPARTSRFASITTRRAQRLIWRFPFGEEGGLFNAKQSIDNGGGGRTPIQTKQINHPHPPPAPPLHYAVVSAGKNSRSRSRKKSEDGYVYTTVYTPPYTTANLTPPHVHPSPLGTLAPLFRGPPPPPLRAPPPPPPCS